MSSRMCERLSLPAMSVPLGLVLIDNVGAYYWQKKVRGMTWHHGCDGIVLASACFQVLLVMEMYVSLC